MKKQINKFVKDKQLQEMNIPHSLVDKIERRSDYDKKHRVVDRHKEKAMRKRKLRPPENNT